MAHVIQLALDAFISSLSVQCHTQSWEGQERYQQFGESESIDIGKSQRLRKEGNARMNNMSAIQRSLRKFAFQDILKVLKLMCICS
jgi:hypothetical protein